MGTPSSSRESLGSEKSAYAPCGWQDWGIGGEYEETESEKTYHP